MEIRSTIFLLRLLATVVIAGAMAAFVAQVRGIADLSIATFLPALAPLVIGGGVGAILLGIATLLDAHLHSPAETVRHLGRIQAQLQDLATKVDELALSVDRSARSRDPGEPLVADTAPAIDPQWLAWMQQVLEELRGNSLLTDQQRQERWQSLGEER